MMSTLNHSDDRILLTLAIKLASTQPGTKAIQALGYEIERVQGRELIESMDLARELIKRIKASN